MPQHIGEIAILVRDYDEAIAWFTQKLGFSLRVKSRPTATPFSRPIPALTQF
jgi:catechol 2,3-dioxygenase-like lactoylglutathione lyase family enzyme